MLVRYGLKAQHPFALEVPRLNARPCAYIVILFVHFESFFRFHFSTSIILVKYIDHASIIPLKIFAPAPHEWPRQDANRAEPVEWSRWCERNTRTERLDGANVLLRNWAEPEVTGNPDAKNFEEERDSID